MSGLSVLTISQKAYTAWKCMSLLSYGFAPSEHPRYIELEIGEPGVIRISLGAFLPTPLAPASGLSTQPGVTAAHGLKVDPSRLARVLVLSVSLEDSRMESSVVATYTAAELAPGLVQALDLRAPGEIVAAEAREWRRFAAFDWSRQRVVSVVAGTSLAGADV